MKTFLFHSNVNTLPVRSLQTHCPIMIRAHVEGNHFSEETCRCDVADIKKEIHPTRCSSNDECPVRKHQKEMGEKVTCVYKLL